MVLFFLYIFKEWHDANFHITGRIACDSSDDDSLTFVQCHVLDVLTALEPSSNSRGGSLRHESSALLVFILPACVMNSPAISGPVIHTGSSPFTWSSRPCHLQHIRLMGPSPFRSPRVLCVIVQRIPILFYSTSDFYLPPFWICWPVAPTFRFWPCPNTSEELVLQSCAFGFICNPFSITSSRKAALVII